MNRIRRVGLYGRVSTEEQALKGFSIEAQVPFCRVSTVTRKDYAKTPLTKIDFMQFNKLLS